MRVRWVQLEEKSTPQEHLCDEMWRMRRPVPSLDPIACMFYRKLRDELQLYSRTQSINVATVHSKNWYTKGQSVFDQITLYRLCSVILSSETWFATLLQIILALPNVSYANLSSLVNVDPAFLNEEEQRRADTK
jgi:hypothetical protein